MVDKEKPVGLLLDALAAVENALTIWSKEYDKELDGDDEKIVNFYGIAISEFHLGYLHKEFANEL